MLKFEACDDLLLTVAGKLSLPSTCPVCEHTPISAEDCKPNKSLRMTTRAFLKTAEKKRDSLQAKEATPITPIDAKSTATPSVTEQAAPPVEPTTDGNSVPKPTQEQEHVANTHGPTADGQPAATVSAEEVQDDAPSVENKVFTSVNPIESLRFILTGSRTSLLMTKQRETQRIKISKSKIVTARMRKMVTPRRL